MKRLIAPLLALAALGITSCATTGTSTGISAGVEISSAPPAPTISYGEHARWRYLTDSGVYVLDDDSAEYDMFRFGTWTYLYGNGYWYRGSSYGGPFVAVNVRLVPHRIFEIRDRDYRWRNHPQAWRPSDHDRDRDRN